MATADHIADAVDVVCLGPMSSEFRDLLREDVRLVEVPDGVTPDPDDLRSAAVVVARGAGVVDAALLETARCLRGIVRTGVGTDNIDVDTASRLGIAVAITPDATLPRWPRERSR